MVARPRQTARRLRVRSLDTLAARLLEGVRTWRVHSAFARAFNLVSERGDLLGVVCEPGANGPATLVLARGDASDATTPLSGMVVPGMPAQVNAREVVIDGALILDCTAAEHWQPIPLTVALPASAIRARMIQAVRLAQHTAPAGGFAPLLSEAAGQHTAGDEVTSGIVDALTVAQARQSMRRLAQAIQAEGWTAAHDAARDLSGLGPGLTPAGDDLLAGLALGLGAVIGALPPALAEALVRATHGRTTDLAAARVRYAVAGHPDEHVHGLLLALLNDAGGPIEAAVVGSLEYGHSSGVDTLVGLLLGVKLGLNQSHDETSSYTTEGRIAPTRHPDPFGSLRVNSGGISR